MHSEVVHTTYYKKYKYVEMKPKNSVFTVES